MVMAGQVKERAALGNFRTLRPESMETEQPRHGAGARSCTGPLRRQVVAGRTSALHPGPDAGLRQSANTEPPSPITPQSCGPKANLSARSTFTLPAGPGQDHDPRARGQQARPAGSPGPPPLTAGPSCRPGAPTCDPADSRPWEQPGPVEVSFRPDERLKETRVGGGGLGFNTPLLTPLSRGAALQDSARHASSVTQGRHAHSPRQLSCHGGA